VAVLHADGLGSVRAVTDATGLATERTTYRPYGEEVAQLQPLTLPETKGFIGERFDDTSGLQYLNARYYDPRLGLFIQPDWWEVMKEGVGTNRYSYSFNDPVNGRDPGGNGAVYADLDGDGENEYAGQINPGDPGYNDDFSRSGVLPSEWVDFNDRLKSAGYDGGPECPHCKTSKSFYPQVPIKYFLRNGAQHFLTLNSYTQTGRALLAKALLEVFNTSWGDKIARSLAKTGKIASVYEMLPFGSGHASYTETAVAVKAAFGTFINTKISQFTYKTVSGILERITLDQAIAHELSHLVSGRYDSASEQYIIDNFENEYLRERRRNLRGSY
jgi:RHS repeat-associated protein